MLPYAFVYGDLASARSSIRILNKLSCLSKGWKDYSRQARFWRPIAAALLPPSINCNLDGRDAAGKQHQRDDDTFYHLVFNHGKSLVHRRLNDDIYPSQEDLLLCIELWDKRDGFLLYSGSGPAYFSAEDDHFRIHMLENEYHHEIAPSFSAASRGYQAGGIRDYLREDNFQSKVTLTCKHTGKALGLWHFNESNGGFSLYYDDNKDMLRPSQPIRLPNVIINDKGKPYNGIILWPYFSLRRRIEEEEDLANTREAEKVWGIPLNVGSSIGITFDGINRGNMHGFFDYLRACMMGYQGQWILNDFEI